MFGCFRTNAGKNDKTILGRLYTRHTLTCNGVGSPGRGTRLVFLGNEFSRFFPHEPSRDALCEDTDN